VHRFLTAHQHNYTIQCYSRWLMLKNTGQMTNQKYRQYTTRQLRSSDSVTCAARGTRATYGDRCFAVAGPRLWNSLPTELRQDSLGQLKRQLKTHLFGLWDHST